jgi:hypothetical protein
MALLKQIDDEVMFDMGNRGQALGLPLVPPKRARIIGYFGEQDGEAVPIPNNAPIDSRRYYAISIRSPEGIYEPHREGDELLPVASDFIKNIPIPMAGGKKKNRKNRKSCRKNRRTSNRRNSRKN